MISIWALGIAPHGIDIHHGTDAEISSMGSLCLYQDSIESRQTDWTLELSFAAAELDDVSTAG